MDNSDLTSDACRLDCSLPSCKSSMKHHSVVYEGLGLKAAAVRGVIASFGLGG